MSLPGYQGEGAGGLSDSGGLEPCVAAAGARPASGGIGPGESDPMPELSPLLRNLGRMIVLHRENEELLERQRRLRSRIAETMEYWRREDANRGLAWARLAQLRAQHRVVLAQLRANRELAHELLERTGTRRDDRAAS